MNNEKKAELLLVEAARWRLIELLLERPRPGWHEEVTALAAELSEVGIDSLIDDVTEGRYLAVFGPGGVISPREVAYRPMGDPGRILTELRGIYEAFGYDPQTEDPPDHVAVQVGFFGFMKLKQAYAVAAGDTVCEQRVTAAAESCMKEHLGGFVAELALKLEHAGLEHLSRCAALLVEICPKLPSSRVSLPMLGVLPAGDDDPWVCDSGCGG